MNLRSFRRLPSHPTPFPSFCPSRANIVPLTCTAYFTQSTVSSKFSKASKFIKCKSISDILTLPSSPSSNFFTTEITALSISEVESRDLSSPKIPEVRYLRISEAVNMPEPSVSRVEKKRDVEVALEEGREGGGVEELERF